MKNSFCASKMKSTARKETEEPTAHCHASFCASGAPSRHSCGRGRQPVPPRRALLRGADGPVPKRLRDATSAQGPQPQPGALSQNGYGDYYYYYRYYYYYYYY